MNFTRAAVLGVLCSMCASPRREAPVPAPTFSAAPPAASVEARVLPDPNEPKPCGDLGCLRFSSPEAAFDYVLRRSPRVLAIGEAHAPKGATADSGAKRFTERLLPHLRGRATDLVVELWVATGGCGKVEQDVAKRQQPVTERQATTNQDEFVEMGHRAKALGVMPHALVPTCEEYAQIVSAGASDIDHMLQMIAQATTREIEHLLAQSPPTPDAATRMIVAYGGALHNDLYPRAGREQWAFGPALREKTGGGYVELDLIVPEFVRDTEAWRGFAWFAAYRASPGASGTLLYSPGEDAFVLIFPRTDSE